MWQAGSGAGMAAKQRRERERVALFVAAVVAATLGIGKRRRACHSDTATSLRSEDGVWQAFRRDAAAQRPPATVPKSNDGDAWR